MNYSKFLPYLAAAGLVLGYAAPTLAAQSFKPTTEQVKQLKERYEKKATKRLDLQPIVYDKAPVANNGAGVDLLIDFDRDGNDEILQPRGSVLWLTKPGIANMDNYSSQSASQYNITDVRMHIKDLDRDGIPEIILEYNVPQHDIYPEAKGVEILAVRNMKFVKLVREECKDFSFADLNHDGRLEFLSTSQIIDTVRKELVTRLCNYKWVQGNMAFDNCGTPSSEKLKP